ncbi:MAG: homoserine kinase [Mycobacterium leprae]
MSKGLRFHVNVPATSANLGPGFDCMGLALNLHNRFTLEVGAPFALSVSGEGAKVLSTGRDNVLARSVQEVLTAADARKVPGDWQLHCENRIPVASGLGSSSTAIVGGLLLGNRLLEHFEPERAFSRDALMQMAIRLEGHPDNVVPALLGGAWLCLSEAERPEIIPLPVPEGLTFVVGVPDFPLSTEASRRVVPTEVSRSDAVYNVAQAARLALALSAGDLGLLGQGFGDRLHEPYRAALIPGMEDVRRAALGAGAAAVTLSGAGPSILAWCADGEAASCVADAMREAWQACGVGAVAHVLDPLREGTRVDLA